MKRSTFLFALPVIALTAILACVSCKKEVPFKAGHITDESKLAMLRSIKDLDGTGRLYEIYYTEDYKLEEVLKSNITDVNKLFQYIAYLLYDELDTKAPKVKYGAGCSVFAVPESESIDFLMGRNYDFRHFTEDKKSYLPTSLPALKIGQDATRFSTILSK